MIIPRLIITKGGTLIRFIYTYTWPIFGVIFFLILIFVRVFGKNEYFGDTSEDLGGYSFGQH